jgi:hypothetical protein
MLILFLVEATSRRTFAANVMNYGADGTDYFQFTTSSMALTRPLASRPSVLWGRRVDTVSHLCLGGKTWQEPALLCSGEKVAAGRMR